MAGGWQDWINGLLGIWLVISGFVPSLMTKWNLIIVGVLVAILGFWSANAE